jgi:hypothetical protein
MNISAFDARRRSLACAGAPGTLCVVTSRRDEPRLIATVHCRRRGASGSAFPRGAMGTRNVVLLNAISGVPIAQP